MQEQWKMDTCEERYLAELPEVVELWRGDDAWLLTQEGAESAARVRARGTGESRLEHIYVRSDRIRAVDLDRQAVQLDNRVRVFA